MLLGSFFAILSVFASGSFLLAETSNTSFTIPPHKSVVDSNVESALKSLFIRELGYTLVGAKPIASDRSHYYLTKDLLVIEKLRDFLRTSFQRSKRFIFKASVCEGGSFEVELIHKSALKRVIRENQELQSFIWKKFGNNAIFFSYLKSKSIFSALDYDDFLLGLVLGYGRTNAACYCRRNAIEEYLHYDLIYLAAPLLAKPKINIHGGALVMYDLDLLPTSPPAPAIKEEFGSLQAEWKWLQKTQWNLKTTLTPPYDVHLPLYVCWHGGDSEKVRERYFKASERLANLFYKRTFAEAICEEASK